MFSGLPRENINAEDIQSNDDKIAEDTISGGVRYSFRLHNTEADTQQVVSGGVYSVSVSHIYNHFRTIKVRKLEI